MHHSFDKSIAIKFGVNEAIFLNNIAYWTHFNFANKKHFHDGRFWTFNSQQAFTIHFPYWSRQNIRTIIDSCVKAGLILRGNYNQKAYDKTTWFSLSDEGLALFTQLKEEIEQSLGWKQPGDKESLGWNQPMDWLESTNGLVGINQPIPDVNTDTKQREREALPALSESQKLRHEVTNNLELFNLFSSKNLTQKYTNIGEFFDYYVEYQESRGNKIGILQFKRWLINEKSLEVPPKTSPNPPNQSKQGVQYVHIQTDREKYTRFISAFMSDSRFGINGRTIESVPPTYEEWLVDEQQKKKAG